MSDLIILASELVAAAAEDIPCHIADGILPQRSLAGFVAQSGAGKTALLIDMVCRMALGLPFCGRATECEGVLYVIGEGAIGMGPRVRAWCAEYDVDPTDLDRKLAFMRVPLDISDEALLLQVLAELDRLSNRRDVIVLDTLSANAPPGFDENRTGDMKAFMDAARGLRDRLDCTVAIVHHTGHDGSRERGSYDFRAALDTMLFVDIQSDLRRLERRKGRDFGPLPPIYFRLKEAHGSVVVEYVQDQLTPTVILPSMRQALEVLREHGEHGLKIRDWKIRCEGHLKRSAFYDTRRRLELAGYVAVDKDRGAVLTRRGEEVLGLSDNVPKLSPPDVRPESSGPVPEVQSAPPVRGTDDRTSVRGGPAGPRRGPVDLSRGVPSGPPIDDGYWSAIESDPEAAA